MSLCRPDTSVEECAEWSIEHTKLHNLEHTDKAITGGDEKMSAVFRQNEKVQP